MFRDGGYFDHKTFFLRGLLWICAHRSHLTARTMAFFLFCGGRLSRCCGLFDRDWIPLKHVSSYFLL